MYEKYFTQDELARLPMYHDEALRDEWKGLVEAAQDLIGTKVAPDSSTAKAFAQRWLDAFGRGTGGDAALAARINLMAQREKEAAGVPPAVMDYMLAAIGALKNDIWARYLAPEVIARMRRHQATRGHEWTVLIDQVREQMARDPDATQPASQALARQWMDLFHDMVGTDPQAIEAFRRATAEVPMLRNGAGINDAMVAWLKQAMRPVSAA